MPDLAGTERVLPVATGAVASEARPQPSSVPPVEVRDLGRLDYQLAFELQRELVERRKRHEIPDQLLIVEHPHVVTLGRNARGENLLASPDLLARAGIALQETDRGGDVTYHGPGQIVCYPILDLREWKRDVVAYVRALEQVLIDALAEFGIAADRSPGATGVWVGQGSGEPGLAEPGLAEPGPAEPAKVAAIGVHISRWVTSHGFALNLDTDLDYFRYIVPCGLTRPVTSLRAVGSGATRSQVIDGLVAAFGRVFHRSMVLRADRMRVGALSAHGRAASDGGLI